MQPNLPMIIFKATSGECDDYTIPAYDKLVLKVAEADKDVEQ